MPRKKIGTICVCCSTGGKSVADSQTPTANYRHMKNWCIRTVGGFTVYLVQLHRVIATVQWGGFLCTNALRLLGESTLPPFSKKLNPLRCCGSIPGLAGAHSKFWAVGQTSYFKRRFYRQYLHLTPSWNFYFIFFIRRCWAVSYFHKTFFSQHPHSHK